VERTYQDFVLFAKTFEEYNCYEFDETSIVKEGGMYYYEATFRDPSNYKTIVRISYDSLHGTISWITGWDDASEEASRLYEYLFNLRQ